MSLNFQRFFASLSAQCANLAGARRGKVAFAAQPVSKRYFRWLAIRDRPAAFDADFLRQDRPRVPFAGFC